MHHRPTYQAKIDAGKEIVLINLPLLAKSTLSPIIPTCLLYFVFVYNVNTRKVLVINQYFYQYESKPNNNCITFIFIFVHSFILCASLYRLRFKHCILSPDFFVSKYAKVPNNGLSNSCMLFNYILRHKGVEEFLSFNMLNF